jgi:hypothetical protein
MNNRKRIIKISNNKFFYTKNDFVELYNTSLQKGNLRFKDRHDIYWSVEVTKLDEIIDAIRIDVLDYNVTDISPFNLQSLRKEVKYIESNNLDWNKLEPQLSSYTESAMLDYFTEEDRINISNRPKSIDPLEQNALTNNHENKSSDFILQNNNTNEYQRNFTYNFKDPIY